MKKKIAVYDSCAHEYPGISTMFRPDTAYPEYKLGDLSETRNAAYESVRECFILLGLDKDNLGKESWNPLGQYICPGNNVLIKPNLVMDVNSNPSGGTDCLYTQPGLVAAVIDYVLIALNGKGEIIVGDAPMQECNFENLKVSSGYEQLEKYYQNKGYPVRLVDFRGLSSIVRNGMYYSTIREDAKGKIVQLGKESDFYDIGKNLEHRLRVTNYDPRILPVHHQGETQEYYISDYILNADVIINMPKPKTHRKAGVTIALKNFVGANVRKEFLPHHTLGSTVENGDEYLNKNIIHAVRSRLLDIRNIYRAEKKYKRARIIQYSMRFCSIILKLTGNKYAEGSWYGNHTISRTINDLNKIVLYANKQGVMQTEKQRKLFIVADMIVSGEGEGPVNPTPKNVGIVAAGDDPVLFDEAIATLMGFDIRKIPTFENIHAYKGVYRLCSSDDEAVFVSNQKALHEKRICDITEDDVLHYEATRGWKGHIEI